MKKSQMNRRSFAKVATGILAAGLPAARLSAQGVYRLTFRLDPNGSCVLMEPRRLNVRKRTSRVVELRAEGSPIQLAYNSDPAEIFVEYPESPVTLQPGVTQRLVIKQNLGIRERGTFENADPAFARSFSFTPGPGGHCSDADHDDMHIEC